MPTSTRSTSPDVAAELRQPDASDQAGFGSNKQYAKLQNLPAASHASVDDNVGAVIGGFPRDPC